MFGPDSLASLSINEISSLVKGARKITDSINSPLDKDKNLDQGLKQIFEKSLSVNKDMKKGRVIEFDDLETKKPKGFGIDANKYKDVINRKINKNLKKWDFLNYDDFD